MIAIIDYGMGNLRSVQKGFEKVGYEAKIVQDRGEVLAARGVILPGVGAFKDAMDNLRDADLIDPIQQVVAKGTPFLGICLGMHLLFETGEEWGIHEGLGLLKGTVRKLPGGVKVPHMGWNQIEVVHESPIIQGIPHGADFYFVHSYYVDPADEKVITTQTDYGIKFTSIVSQGNVFGIQFHPEKSSALGLQILKNFGELIEKCC
ncbi:MAG: imidazole glycerol phosphate synthase subunit HisH [Clostridia bacterium]|nr:imidazole glycerol phosphate synthase subunit HisH [Clostridia bacterium]